MYNLKEIAQITGGTLIRGNAQTRVTSVHFDTRLLQTNSLFVALTGGERDGHDFIKQAIEAGANTALVSKEVMATDLDGLALILVDNTQQAFQDIARAYRQQLNIPIIAITGSNGKTTTKDMLAHLLTKKFKVYKTHRNLNNELGLPLSILQITAEHEVAVLELGMNHAGEIDLLASIAKPTISVITNVGDAHLGNFGSRGKIAEAKGELLPHTNPDMYILLNGDDQLVRSLAQTYSGKTYFFGLSPHNDIYATDLQTNDEGTSFTLHYQQQTLPCFLPTFGTYNVANSLPGIFIAAQLGIPMTELREALQHLAMSDMRFQILTGPQESILINDAYNASPTSMKAAIDTFMEIYPSRKKILVLGDILELGEQENELHTEIGKYLQKKEVTLLTLGERARYISAEAGGEHFSNYAEVAERLTPYLNKDMAVLFKASRGMKLEEIIKLL